MRQTWQCDYCGEVFLTKEEAAEHEKNCGRNPENKITDPTIFPTGYDFGQTAIDYSRSSL